MIDFHCHLDLYDNPTNVLDGAEAKGVYILAITTTPAAWPGMKRLTKDRGRVRIAAGLHPELVAERHSEVAALEKLLPETKYIGEIGLDGSPQHRGSFQIQDRVFRRILHGCAKAGGRVLSIHSRAATDGVLDALCNEPDAGIPILHWFSGGMKELERAINLGCWFSVGPAMLKSAKGRRLAEAMPHDRLLTETDAPFSRDRADNPLMPWDVCEAEIVLGNIWQTTAGAVHEKLLNNLRQLGRSTDIIQIRKSKEDQNGLC